MVGRPVGIRGPAPLRWHLVLLVLGALLPVMIFALVVERQLAVSEQAAAQRRLLRSTRELSALLDRELLGTLRVLSVLGQSERLERGDLQAFHAEAGRVCRTQPSWLTILVFSPDGTPLVSTREPWGAPLLAAVEPASLRQILKTGQPAVGNLALGQRDKSYAFAVRVPVFRSGRLLYVLTAVMRPAVLSGLVSQRLPGSEEWTRTVVDGNGLVVARTRQPGRFLGQKGTPSFLRLIRSATEGISRETSLEGTQVYLAFSRSSVCNWTVSIAVPREALEGPARRSRLAVAAIGLALLALSGVGAFFYSRPLSRSIESAAAAAETLARGGRPLAAPSNVREVADLGQALERSADLLAEREEERNEHLARAEAARAEAETANRAKDEFLAMLGHELRNPLGPIRNGVHLLRDILPADARAERVREIIERQVVHITRMVDDLLETSRIVRGKITLKRRVLDLRNLVRETQEGFRPRFEAAEIRLESSLPQEPVWVEGDETRLAQCLGNLLHNALKFTPAGGAVAVSLSTIAAPETPQARLEVRDDGAGIDPVLIPFLFEPFSQAPQALDRSQGGLGLGLALVKGIVGLHGGSVEAESPGLGQGTRFTLHLPLAARRAEPAQAVAETHGEHHHRVLVVEDLPDAAESLELLLTLAGHDVRVALTAGDALKIAAEHEPGVVVCDIGLPDMDGYTLCRRLREMPALHGTSFIALTGYGQAEDVRRALDAGFAVHLTKPVEPTVLRDLVANPPAA